MTMEELKAERKKVQTERKAIIEAYKECVEKMKGLRAEKVMNQKKINDLNNQINTQKKAS